MGPDAKAAIPTLTEALRGTDVNLRRITAAALEKIGKSKK
jgi:HEAT repeat protein